MTFDYATEIHIPITITATKPPTENDIANALKADKGPQTAVPQAWWSRVEEIVKDIGGLVAVRENYARPECNVDLKNLRVDPLKGAFIKP